MHIRNRKTKRYYYTIKIRNQKFTSLKKRSRKNVPVTPHTILIRHCFIIFIIEIHVAHDINSIFLQSIMNMNYIISNINRTVRMQIFAHHKESLKRKFLSRQQKKPPNDRKTISRNAI